LFFLEQVFESPRIPLKWKLVGQMDIYGNVDRESGSHAGATRNAGVKLTRRGKRVVRGVVGVSLLVVIGAGFSAVSSDATNNHQSISTSNGYVKVTVAPGETLWSLASLVADGRDIAVVVDQIVEANSLTSSDITVGERLWVPAH